MSDIYRQDLILWHDARVEMPDPNSGREFFVYNNYYIGIAEYRMGARPRLLVFRA